MGVQKAPSLQTVVGIDQYGLDQVQGTRCSGSVPLELFDIALVIEVALGTDPVGAVLRLGRTDSASVPLLVLDVVLVDAALPPGMENCCQDHLFVLGTVLSVLAPVAGLEIVADLGLGIGSAGPALVLGTEAADPVVVPETALALAVFVGLAETVPVVLNFERVLHTDC